MDKARLILTCGLPAAGKTTLWAEGDRFRAMRASAPKMISGPQFERTAALIDVSERDSYLLDVFRVVGGKDHAKFFHSHFGVTKTEGLRKQKCFNAIYTYSINLPFCELYTRHFSIDHRRPTFL